MSSRTLAYAGLLLGGVLALVAAGQGAGLTAAPALAGLAGTLLLLTVRSRGRRVAGVALALVGLGLTVTGVAAGLSGWRIAYAAGGLLVLLGAVLTVVKAPRWPSRTERFTPGDEPADLWRAQDAGLDPTAESNDPDVRETSSGETMRPAEPPRRPSRRK